ncbi:hypothetical protein J7E93_16875 [Streptomyces sp. ISL-36]|uniref:hypothetical protein n=1 Tax=Streptomyces sp. ISL-36 TaxID=2819182 RepID=UPI001BEB9F21|nr:hypothetical protein [Streptomyces sp. ISL-36]MBT2441757.1 hypothetical protein [Streptomyces sp. ISL-36]
MLTETANRDSRLSFWLRVREFAVPPSMIETATARRCAGDWAGACAAAGFDIDLDLRSLARSHGRDLAARIRADLRHLAPDLLRWHMPRIAPDGLLRPGLTISLARYDADGPDGARPMHLVARTAPAWADAGQRISLALWDGSFSDVGTCRHPHPRPHRKYRLDLHRHLWDARRADELRLRSGAELPAVGGRDGRTPDTEPPDPDLLDPELLAAVPPGHRCAVHRWAAEAAILLQADKRSTRTFTVRFGARHRLVLDLDLDLVLDLAEDGDADRGGNGRANGVASPTLRIAAAPTDGSTSALPVLPDAATWVLPDLELLRTGSIEAHRLHPLVASALLSEHSPAAPPHIPDRARQPRLVECRGARHRIGLVDGALTALDHDPAEIRREELLVALTGTPLPCLQAIDEAHRRPDCLTGVRERLDHGDTAGAIAVVEALLGPEALLRTGPLRDALETAALQRITYGLYRSGLIEPGPGRMTPGDHRRTREHRRSHPRRATSR